MDGLWMGGRLDFDMQLHQEYVFTIGGRSLEDIKLMLGACVSSTLKKWLVDRRIIANLALMNITDLTSIR